MCGRGRHNVVVVFSIAKWRGLSSSAAAGVTGVSEEVRRFASQEYQYGFSTDLDTDIVPRGLSEDVIRLISAKKGEPEWLVEWRLRAYRHWLTLEEPRWQNVHYGPIDYQDIIYYAAPKPKAELASLDEVDPEVRAMFDKLGHLPRRAGAAERRGDRRRRRLGVGGDDLQGEARRGGRHLLLVLRGGAEPPRARAEIPRLGRALPGQLLRDPQLRGLHRRLVLLHPQGRALPDGAVHLLPHQRRRRRASSSGRSSSPRRART